MYKLDYECKKDMDERLFNITNKLLLSAGPTNCSSRVLKALSLPTLTPVSSEMYKMMDEIKELSQYLFQTKNTLTVLHQTSGTGGIETALINLVAPGEKVLIGVSGLWGTRTVSKAERAGMNVASFQVQPGEVFTLKEIEEQIVKHKPVLLSLTHAESSGGTIQPLEGVGELCHKYNCLLLIDAVISLGTDPLFVDKWKIDVAIGATQKGLGVPPGMALLTFSPRAEKMIFNRNWNVSFYNDMQLIADYWNCRGNPRKYCYTYNSHMIAGVRESLMQIFEEGLVNVWERHTKCTERFWKSLEERGLKLFVKNAKNRAHSVTIFAVPSNIKWEALMDYLDKKYAVEIGFGIGPSLGNNNVRVGFMNVNCKDEVIDYFLKVFDETIDYLKLNEYKGSSRSETV